MIKVIECSQFHDQVDLAAIFKRFHQSDNVRVVESVETWLISGSVDRGLT